MDETYEANSQSGIGINLRQRDLKDGQEHESSVDIASESSRSAWWITRPLYVLLPYLHLKRKIRVIYFIIASISLSVLGAGGEYFCIEIFASKGSIFNQYFVKLGWGWTVSLIVLLRGCCLPLHSNWKQHFWNLLIRVIVLTIFFYIWCQVFFPSIEEWTGRCVKQGIVSDIANITKKSCLKMKNHSFFALDISGHSFLMPYCIFALMEESKELIYVLCLGQFLRNSSQNLQSSIVSPLSSEELGSLKKIYFKTIPFVVVSTILIFCLSLLWDFMFILTSLYYHTITEKLLGTMLGILSWYFQHHLLFQAFDIL